jgi:hypothetical protein
VLCYVLRLTFVSGFESHSPASFLLLRQRQEILTLELPTRLRQEPNYDFEEVGKTVRRCCEKPDDFERFD